MFKDVCRLTTAHSPFEWFPFLQVQASENSDLKEHCSVYVLSSQTQTEFKQQCNYRHDERCEECKAVESTLAGIERLV